MSTAAEPSRGSVRVGFLGPAGTFSEEALLAGADPALIEAVALESIYETVAALRRGEVEFSLVPIENSLEGSINVTLDLLAGEASDVRIVGEELLRVRHSLIGAGEVALADIDTVVSHPQVPGQCERLLHGELAHARVLPAASTAEAVRAVVSAGELSTAALGTALAARIYGATVLREGVEDRHDNETRFVWLARNSDEPRELPIRAGREGGAWRCSIVFWGPGANRAGWLVRCLSEFSQRGIDLTKIESRPRREGMGSYMFFAEMAGGEGDVAVGEALHGLRSMCDTVRVLGSYRSAAREGG
jgi:prephenate dehydratase